MASRQLLAIVVKQCLDSQQPEIATGRHRQEISEPATFLIPPKHHQFIDSWIHRMVKGSAAEAEPVNFLASISKRPGCVQSAINWEAGWSAERIIGPALKTALLSMRNCFSMLQCMLPPRDQWRCRLLSGRNLNSSEHMLLFRPNDSEQCHMIPPPMNLLVSPL